MKILLVSIPNHHFFQWTNQLKESGFDVYWFDITDGAGFVEKINWVKQFHGWKLRWKYPFRYRIKKHFPKLYFLLGKIISYKTEVVFETIIKEIQPDIIHCFEMKLAGLPILSIMKENKIPFIYSSWGSDMFDYKNLGVTIIDAKSFLRRVDYLITDCKRDFKIAQQLGFVNQFLGVFPGNGGIEIENNFIMPVRDRKTICIKGYDDGVGKALVVIKAIESIQFDPQIDFLIFSADENVVVHLENSDFFKQKKVEIIPRNSFLVNKLLLQKFGSCLLYIGNSISDGMPNSLLEAMGMGAFPIQSNPGNVASEVIKDGTNGYVISHPLNTSITAQLIKSAIDNQESRILAQKSNIDFIAKNYSRNKLQKEIVELYNLVFLNKANNM